MRDDNSGWGMNEHLRAASAAPARWRGGLQLTGPSWWLGLELGLGTGAWRGALMAMVDHNAAAKRTQFSSSLAY